MNEELFDRLRDLAFYTDQHCKPDQRPVTYEFIREELREIVDAIEAGDA